MPDLDTLSERDWRRLVETVKRGNCILLLGPAAAVDPGGESLGKALGIAGQLANNDRENLDYRIALAMDHAGLARMHLAGSEQASALLAHEAARGGRGKAATRATGVSAGPDAARKAVELLEQESKPGNPRWEEAAAFTRIALGDALAAQGDLAGALNEYETGPKVLARSSTDAGEGELSATLSNRSGNLFLRLGDEKEALASFEKAKSMEEKQGDEMRSFPGWQEVRAAAREGIGDVQLAAGKPLEALESYREALKIRRKLADADPGNARALAGLAVSLYKAGSIGKGERGRSEVRRAAEILKRLRTERRLPPPLQGWRIQSAPNAK